jgi:hypothetical protein
LADTFRDFDPGFRFELAQVIADYASQARAPAEGRRRAHAVVLSLLDSFPAEHPFARDAALLRSNVMLWQQLPTADNRPVTDREQAEFLAWILRDQDSTGPEAQRPRSAAIPTQTPPSGYSPPPVYVPSNPSGEVHVDGYYRANGTYVKPYNRSAPRR